MLQGMNILYENNSLVHYYFPIVQWGYGEGSFTFPISFTEACYSVSLTSSTGNHEHSLILTSKNLTNITWKSKGTNQSNGETSGYVFVVGI